MGPSSLAPRPVPGDRQSLSSLVSDSRQRGLSVNLCSRACRFRESCTRHMSHGTCHTARVTRHTHTHTHSARSAHRSCAHADTQQSTHITHTHTHTHAHSEQNTERAQRAEGEHTESTERAHREHRESAQGAHGAQSTQSAQRSTLHASRPEHVAQHAHPRRMGMQAMERALYPRA